MKKQKKKRAVNAGSNSSVVPILSTFKNLGIITY